MVTYDELNTTNLGALNTAATDIAQMVRNWEYDSDFQSQVVNPLQASGWSGPASEAAVTQLTAARTQIDEAFDETSAMAKALGDAHDQLLACQSTLHQIQQDAAGQGLTISADGSDITWSVPPNLPHNAGIHEQYQQAMQQQADAISQRITAVLQQATDIDQTAAAALAADTGANASAFNATPVGGIDEEEAQQAAALARQGGNLTDAQLAQLDALLKANSGDSRFTTAFFQDLGPQESLLFYGQLAWTASGNGANDQTRANLLKDMQAQLGTSLATATSLQGWPHLSDAWEAGLRQAGGQKMQLDMVNPNDPQGQVYGYQILSDYLRTGTYDEHFLLPVAEDITNLSEQDPTKWVNESLEGSNDRLNFLDATAGYNPLSGMLEALGRSPKASLDFFSANNNNYFNYLTSDSNNNALLISDSTGVGPTAYAAAYKAQMSTLGDALQSATTGVPFDAANGVQLPLHTPAMAALANKIVTKFGQNPGLLSGEDGVNPLFAPLNSSIGHITASYIGDVDQSLSGTSNRLSLYGAPAGFSSANVQTLLHALGRDPDAYGAVVQAQNAYTAVQLQNVVQTSGAQYPDLPAALNNVSQDGAMVNGILSRSKIQELQQNSAASDAAYNAAINQNAGIANTVWSMTLGNVVGKVPVVGGFLNNGVSSYINTLAASSYENSSLATVQAGTLNDTQALQGTMSNARLSVSRALQGSGLTQQQISDIADSAANNASNGFYGGGIVDMITQGN